MVPFGSLNQSAFKPAASWRETIFNPEMLSLFFKVSAPVPWHGILIYCSLALPACCSPSPPPLSHASLPLLTPSRSSLSPSCPLFATLSMPLNVIFHTKCNMSLLKGQNSWFLWLPLAETILLSPSGLSFILLFACYRCTARLTITRSYVTMLCSV